MTNSEDQEQNAVLNEEYKIWKKAVPVLYSHITTYKPLLSEPLNASGENTVPKKGQELCTFTFENILAPVVEQANSGVCSSTVYYSRGKTLYSFDVNLPQGLLTQDTSLISPISVPSATALKLTNEYKVISTNDKHEYVKIKKLPQHQLLSLDTGNNLTWNHCVSKNVSMTYECENTGAPVTDFEIYKTEMIATSSGEIIDYKTAKQLSNLKIPQGVFASVHTQQQAPRFKNTNELVYINNDGTQLLSADTRASTASTSPVINYSKTADYTPNSKFTCFDHSHLAETLFVTGSTDGLIKVWDSRMATTPVHTLFHTQNENSTSAGVSKIQFKPNSPMEFLSVCADYGFIYQWNLEPLVNYQQSLAARPAEDADEMEITELDNEELNSRCLKYVHTSGSRRKRSKTVSKLENQTTNSSGSMGSAEKRQIMLNQCEWNPYMDDVVGCLDNDGTLVVYKGWFGQQK
ncbi:hypothetical protein ACO0RG_002873 [Hanseniaspora osmophila]